ncbi:MAG: septal ring lytic transglycosylase RlpA family protein [Campylobacterota bacterium]|nr:septal ring lytic transglycosylase RlpA family protein [Campylobacterota bacterium]
MSNLYIYISIVMALIFSGCASSSSPYRDYSYSKPRTIYTKSTVYSAKKSQHSPVMDSKTYSHPTMRPYVIRGIKYYPTTVSVGDEFSGNASWYGPAFHGKLTSNGEKYNMYDMTAAHKTLPMNTIVKVTNRRNGLSTVVRVNDRGPFIATRIIDLSKTAASQIDMIGAGTAPVQLEVLGFHKSGRKNIPTKQELKRNIQKKSIGFFALQIASFSNIKGAIKTQERYNGTDGYKTMIKDVNIGNKRLFKVLLTGFKSQQEARDYKATCKFNNSFIVGE